MVRCKATIFSATKTPVGAGLPAKAPAHSKSSSPVTPLSRASSLPQWSGARPQSSAQPKFLWERACSRRRRHIQHHHRLSHRFREQAHSYKDPGADQQSFSQPKSLWERAREGARSDTFALNDTTFFTRWLTTAAHRMTAAHRQGRPIAGLPYFSPSRSTQPL